jgi:hypothetical protein
MHQDSCNRNDAPWDPEIARVHIREYAHREGGLLPMLHALPAGMS